MTLLAKILIGFVASFHLYVLWLEMFAWTTKGPKVFRNFPKELFPKTKAMAANQGLYNGFLAAGLIWSLCISNTVWSIYVAIFFLSCVIVAGIYGPIPPQRKYFSFKPYLQLLHLLLYIFKQKSPAKAGLFIYLKILLFNVNLKTI